MSKNEKPSILIVEDERNTRDAMARYLRSRYELTIAEDGMRAVNILKKNNFDVVLTDLRMPEADGMTVLKSCQDKSPPPACVMITAYGSIETAVEAMKRGAFDFIAKPLNLDRLDIILERALEARRLKEENRELRGRLERKFGVEGIIGNSAAMTEVLDTVRQVAPTRSTVLVSGESGTGKEMIAQTLHQLSGRTGRFVPVHCAALSANLLESELFGHEKGAFTGAVEQRVGRFELADKGTLFLDEIAEIDPSVQVKLLRALETRAFERVGGMTTVETDTRVVTATNRDLRNMVESNEFREDLFYRLDVVRIDLPPLRRRRDDIPLLIDHFLKECAAENGKDVKGVTDEVMNVLCDYAWPGNIRELRNCVERMVVLSRKNILGLELVPPQVRSGESAGGVSALSGTDTLDLDDNERRLIVQALRDHGGNRTKAAKALGISRRTLHRKINHYGLD